MPLLLLPLAPFVATFGLFVVNILYNIGGAIFVVDFTVVLLVGISVLGSDAAVALNVTGDGIVVVTVDDAIFDAVADDDDDGGSGTTVLVLFTSFDTFGMGTTAFDVTF